jgi:acyl-coenzyme A synthetase/AMP-(fatty) acid ligase
MFDAVEDEILQIETVVECCIVGIPDKSDDNNIPIALVVANTKDTIQLKGSILKRLEEKFATEHKISKIYFVEKLLRTVTGKLLRYKNQNLAIDFYKNDIKIQ